MRPWSQPVLAGAGSSVARALHELPMGHWMGGRGFWCVGNQWAAGDRRPSGDGNLWPRPPWPVSLLAINCWLLAARRLMELPCLSFTSSINTATHHLWGLLRSVLINSCPLGLLALRRCAWTHRVSRHVDLSPGSGACRHLAFVKYYLTPDVFPAHVKSMQGTNTQRGWTSGGVSLWFLLHPPSVPVLLL